MDIKAIYLDCDGVLVNFVGAALSLYGIRDNPNTPSWSKVKTWDGIKDTVYQETGRTLTDEQLWKRIESEGQAFWAGLEWLPWGKRLFNKCAETAPVVLMTTPTHSPSCAAGKIEWINKNMPKEWQRRYALTPCKHHFSHPGALLVDDSDTNCKNFREHGGQVYQWAMPWNQSERDHNYSVSERLNDFDEYLEQIKRRRSLK